MAQAALVVPVVKQAAEDKQGLVAQAARQAGLGTGVKAALAALRCLTQGQWPIRGRRYKTWRWRWLMGQRWLMR